MSASGWVHLDVLLIQKETEAAFFVLTDDGDFWLPKSQVADVEDYREGDENVTLSITEWVAREKGVN